MTGDFSNPQQGSCPTCGRCPTCGNYRAPNLGIGPYFNGGNTVPCNEGLALGSVGESNKTGFIGQNENDKGLRGCGKNLPCEDHDRSLRQKMASPTP